MMFQVKCADCGCLPQECRNSNSSKACPNCTWNECCCYNAGERQMFGKENDEQKAVFEKHLFREIMKAVVKDQEKKFRIAIRHAANCDKCFPKFYELMNEIALHMLFRNDERQNLRR